VNDKVVVDYVDEKNTYSKGLLALQQHNKGSVVEFRNLMMRSLPATICYPIGYGSPFHARG
jgi:hypothetical protein